MENLKNALLTVINTAVTTIEALEDGNINVREGISITWSAIGFIKVVKSFPVISNEFLSLSAEQKQELILWFNQEFDIADDNAEQTVEMIFATLLELSNIFTLVTSKSQ